MHDVGRAGLQDGEKVVVVGGGPVGVLIALAARAVGAEVRVVEPSAHRRLLAEELGLITWNPTGTNVSERVGQWTAGAGADVASKALARPPGWTQRSKSSVCGAGCAWSSSIPGTAR
ncbi:hypothetical protein GCM10023083_63000 [Streptomyces phyllanthi]